MTQSQTSAPYDHGWRKRVLTLNRGNQQLGGRYTACSHNNILCVTLGGQARAQTDIVQYMA